MPSSHPQILLVLFSPVLSKIFFPLSGEKTGVIHFTPGERFRV